MQDTNTRNYLAGGGKQFSELPEADQLAGLLVPEAKRQGANAGNKSDPFDIGKHLVLFVTAFQVVIGYLGTEVMDVMIANISGKPLQKPGKLQEGASFHGHSHVIPFFLSAPDHIFKLVLNIE